MIGKGATAGEADNLAGIPMERVLKIDNGFIFLNLFQAS
jgi:hypothetical protein